MTKSKRLIMVKIRTLSLTMIGSRSVSSVSTLMIRSEKVSLKMKTKIVMLT